MKAKVYGDLLWMPEVLLAELQNLAATWKGSCNTPHLLETGGKQVLPMSIFL